MMETEKNCKTKSRVGSRTAATSKMERFVIIVNGWKLTASSWMLQQS